MKREVYVYMYVNFMKIPSNIMKRRKYMNVKWAPMEAVNSKRVNT